MLDEQCLQTAFKELVSLLAESTSKRFQSDMFALNNNSTGVHI